MKAVGVLLVLLAVSTAGATVSLRVNGTDCESIVLKVGQPMTAEVVSSDAAVYIVYAGFDETDSEMGAFHYLSTLPAAGNLASMQAVNAPPVAGYYLSAGGMNPAPTAGAHFRFSYTPEKDGVATLLLYAKDGVKVLDAVSILVEPTALGSAFTYQGQLLDGGEGRDGVYDFEFRLFDAPTGGKQFGETNYGDDIEVTKGYFTAELDFGSEAYTGDSAWLEVAVKEGFAKVPFTVLAPRQRLTAAPNASFASRSDWNGLLNMPADFADGVDNDTHLSESTVEYYVLNDVTPGTIPYRNPSKLLDTPLQYSPADGTLKVGGSFNNERKFSVFTDSNLTAIYAETARSSGVNIGVRSAATGDTSNNSYGLWGTSSSHLGHNFGVYGSASAASSGTNYGVYGYAFNGGGGDAYAGYFNGMVHVNGLLNVDGALQAAASPDRNVVIGGNGSSNRKLSVYTSTTPESIYAENAGTGYYSYGVKGVVSGNTSYTGFGVYGSSSSTSGNNCGVYGISLGDTPADSYGLYGMSLSQSGDNYGVMGLANAMTEGTNYGVYGRALGGAKGSYAGYFSGNVHITSNLYVVGNLSAVAITDRTPYPEDMATAVEAVMSMGPLGEGVYDATNKEQQLDHSQLSDFVRSEDGKRDLSATVSCHNEVLKALLGAREELTAAQAQIRALQEENAAMKARLAAIETALGRVQ